MNDLIEALTILAKYDQPKYPTGCFHDVLVIYIDPALVSEEDKDRLDQLGISCEANEDWEDCFYSYRFGSA